MIPFAVAQKWRILIDLVPCFFPCWRGVEEMLKSKKGHLGNEVFILKLGADISEPLLYLRSSWRAAIFLLYCLGPRCLQHPVCPAIRPLKSAVAVI